MEPDFNPADLLAQLGALNKTRRVSENIAQMAESLMEGILVTVESGEEELSEVLGELTVLNKIVIGAA
jgi:hypothetical protein